MERILLSAHFALEEFTRSDVAERHGIVITVDPGSEVETCLKALCGEILEPARGALGPITILSGYRPEEVNHLVGGASSSQHCKGQAADIIMGGLTPLELCKWFEQSKLPVDQCIHEFGRWCHVSFNPHGVPRRQFLTAKFDKTEGVTAYHQGLHAMEDLP